MSASLRCYHRKARRYRLKGLTSLGKPRVRTRNAINAEERLALRRARGLRAWNNRVQKLRGLNLTTRGSKRVYLVNRADALILRSQIDALALELARSFADMSPAAQGRVMALEAVLSGVRKQL